MLKKVRLSRQRQDIKVFAPMVCAHRRAVEFCTTFFDYRSYPNAGLPDGEFEYQISHFWYVLEGLGMKNF
jgi:hypothetical protein